jgi:DNA-binding response OmpR family regulator
MTSDMTILIADDELSVREIIRRYLEKEGYTVIEADNGPKALQMLYEQKPDLLILDIMLPGLDGYTIARSLRNPESQDESDFNRNIPIIMLTSRTEEEDRLKGFELGADDYVGKPFSPREVVMRVKAVLRRGQQSPDIIKSNEQTLSVGNLSINPNSRTVHLGDKSIMLTAKEFDLLLFLAENPQQVFTRNQLLNHIWGYEFYGDDSTITVHIHRLREKIEPDPNQPTYIHTVWGVGYRFEASAS